MKKEDLLKVLDMSEDEQLVWTLKIGHGDRHINESLADLAFRLRDEAAEKDWVGWQVSSCYVWEATHDSEYCPGKFGNRAKPIEWVIAALIAKGE